MSGPLCEVAPASFLGHTDEELRDTLDQPAAAAAKRRVIETGVSADIEFVQPTANGRAYYSLHIEPARAADGSIEGIVCAAQDITDRKDREAHLHMLMREITHRSKNLLAVIQGMARQTARHAGTIGNFLQVFSARLQALAHSHDLLVQQSWHRAALEDLVRKQMGPYLEYPDGRVTIEGPPIWLDPEAAQSVGLALHELAANAAKFGALSRADGKVSVAWQQDGKEVEILWTESGGPAVMTARTPGFGSLVLEKNLPRALDAHVQLDFRPEGLRCRIAVPVKHLATPERPEHLADTPR
jgi:two-component sensor histidine kinase